MKIIVGMTGASGSIFAEEFLKICPGEKYLIASRWGKSVLAQETGRTLENLAPYAKKIFSNDDLSSPFASGSNAFQAMVIVPCSVSTLSKIACGIADSLLTRAAAVALKERRKLILCLRETPLSTVAIENMLKLSQAGAVIMPISPSFYQGAQDLKDLARLFAERIVQLIDPEFTATGWKQEVL